MQTDGGRASGPARGRGPACGRRRAAGPPRRGTACWPPTPARSSGDEIRLSLAARGIEFGPAFSGLARVHTAADGATLLAEIGAPAAIRAQQSGYGIHPAVLDACFQSVGAHLLVGGAGDGGLLLPLSVGRLRRFGAGRDARYCLVTVTKADAAAIEADLEVLDGNGDVVLEVSATPDGQRRHQEPANVNGCSPNGC